jgi:hypothetical protein
VFICAMLCHSLGILVIGVWFGWILESGHVLLSCLIVGRIICRKLVIFV